MARACPKNEIQKWGWVCSSVQSPVLRQRTRIPALGSWGIIPLGSHQMSKVERIKQQPASHTLETTGRNTSELAGAEWGGRPMGRHECAAVFSLYRHLVITSPFRLCSFAVLREQENKHPILSGDLEWLLGTATHTAGGQVTEIPSCTGQQDRCPGTTQAQDKPACGVPKAAGPLGPLDGYTLPSLDLGAPTVRS